MTSPTANDRPDTVRPGLTSVHALATVAKHHGLHLSVEQMIRDNAITEEPGLAGLAAIAKKNNLEARVTKLTWQQLFRLGKALPAVLRFNNGQYVVLIAVEEGPTPIVILQDPLSPDEACISVDKVRLETNWDGDAILIKRRYRLSDTERPFGLVWITGQVLKEKIIFRDVGIAALIISFFALVPPLVFMTIVDRILVHQRLSTLHILTTGVCFVILFDMIFGFLRRKLLALGSAKIDARMSTYIFDKMVNLPIDYFERNPTGVISYKLGEVWRIRNFLTGQLFGTILDSTVLFVLLPVMFYISSPLTFFVLGLSILMSVVVLAYIAPMAQSRGLGRPRLPSLGFP
ncbi:ABC transporter transmembrane domain-containing protein [Pararhodospirillum photometricum]|nr:ABC transporter transmembrane domain-containing protein [Pararhodospirillum photometricum]